MLSFIIPVYKPNIPVFAKCLKSLAEQSLKDWEGIVVLDGPNDEARLEADRYADRFRVIEIEHGGANKARNEGFKHSKGDIVSFWDCDCIIEPDAANMWVEQLTKHPEYDFIYSGYKFLDEKGGIASEEFDPWLLQVNNYISTCFPIRRVSFPGFDETLKSLQDWDMWLSAVEKGSKGMFIAGYAFSTALPTPDSISGKGCTDDEWLNRIDIVKKKHNISEKDICVSSLSHKAEGIRLAKLLGADYRDIPNYKPNRYKTIIQLGFSLHPSRVGNHAHIFSQKGVKKILFWTMGDIVEIANFISLKASRLYAERLNGSVKQYCEDLAAKKILEQAGFIVEILPAPLVNHTDIPTMPEKQRILIDITEDYAQLFAVIRKAIPDFEYDFLHTDKPLKNFTHLLSLNSEKTMSYQVKRMLLTGRHVISNIQSPFCGYVADSQEPDMFIAGIVDTIRKSVGKDTTAQIGFWTKALSAEKVMEVLK